MTTKNEILAVEDLVLQLIHETRILGISLAKEVDSSGKCDSTNRDYYGTMAVNLGRLRKQCDQLITNISYARRTDE